MVAKDNSYFSSERFPHRSPRIGDSGRNQSVWAKTTGRVEPGWHPFRVAPLPWKFRVARETFHRGLHAHQQNVQAKL